MIRVVKGSYFWVMGFTMTALFYVLCALQHARVVLFRLPRDGRLVHSVASLWGRTIVDLVPGWHVTVVGREHLLPDGQPSVIVANHESMADIWALYYLNVQFRWLSKDTVFKLPMIGRAMVWCNYVSVNRKSRESGADALRASADRLRLGLAMFFFPEGTRSPDGTIKAFKLGAFKLAQTNQVPVQAIAIHGAGDLLRKGSLMPNDSAHVKVQILPPFPPPRGDEDLTAFAAKVRAAVVEAHNSLI